MEDLARHHLRLLVDNFKDCFFFYRDVLELPVRYGGENDTYAEFKSDAIHLALFKKDLMAQVTHTRCRPLPEDTADGLAIILRVRDVDRVCEKLKSRGVVFATEPADRKAWGCRTAHFRDPDGNLLELNADLG